MALSSINYCNEPSSAKPLILLRTSHETRVVNVTLGYLNINPFPDEQLNLLGIVPEQDCHFSSLSIFYLGCKLVRFCASKCIKVHHHKNAVRQVKG